MRDPDLVTRAQRAAVALERAWERWRAMHGLSADPMPPVSSYVGYSTEEPWGRPRVVFGVDAREAELLAALLDHHECVGPFYQEPTSRAGYGTGASGRSGSSLDEARSRIPAQAQAAEEQPAQWDQDAPWDQDAQWDEDAQAWPGGRRRGRSRRARQIPGARQIPAAWLARPMTFAVTSSTTLTPCSRRSRARRTAWRIWRRHDEAHGSNGNGRGDQRRGRRTDLSRPSRRERRAAGRQRSAGTRGAVNGPAHTEASHTDATEHTADGRTTRGGVAGGCVRPVLDGWGSGPRGRGFRNRRSRIRRTCTGSPVPAAPRLTAPHPAVPRLRCASGRPGPGGSAPGSLGAAAPHV